MDKELLSQFPDLEAQYELCDDELIAFAESYSREVYEMLKAESTDPAARERIDRLQL